jgi:hypothetical protein
MARAKKTNNTLFIVSIVVLVLVVFVYLLLFKRRLEEPGRTASILVSEISVDDTVRTVPIQIALAPDQTIHQPTKRCCGALVSSLMNPACKRCDSMACSISACGQDRSEPEAFLNI